METSVLQRHYASDAMAADDGALILEVSLVLGLHPLIWIAAEQRGKRCYLLSSRLSGC